MPTRFPRTARACLLGLGLALATTSARAQNRIAVEPGRVDLARGMNTTFAVKKDIGQGWQESTADEWYTLVEPSKLGVFKVLGGALVFEAEMEGAGELHIWHKTKLSWSGLYAKVPVTVRERAAPVQPTPPVRPTPASPTPAKPSPAPKAPPVPAGSGLDVFRMGSVPATWIDPAGEIPIAPGESVVLAVYSAATPTATLDLVPAAEPGVTARIVAGRVEIQLQRETPQGQRIELALRCRATGASVRLRLVAGAVGAAPAGVRMWIRRGFDGTWQLLPPESGIALRPGGVVFIAAEAVCDRGRPAVGTVSLAMPDVPDFGLRPVGPGLWLLASGAPTNFEARGVIAAGVAGTRVARSIAVAFGE